jgi:hypothetical protein
MTWLFMYAAVLVVGLVLAAVAGLARDLRSLAHHVVVPQPDRHFAVLALFGRRLAAALVLSGALGLVMSARPFADPKRTLAVALAVGAVGFVLAFAFLRPPCAELGRIVKATVVRDIPPGGYGQIRLERAEGSVVFAAQSVDAGTIPAGSEVEVVDCTRSVITVRQLTPA